MRKITAIILVTSALAACDSNPFSNPKEDLKTKVSEFRKNTFPKVIDLMKIEEEYTDRTSKDRTNAEDKGNPYIQLSFEDGNVYEMAANPYEDDTPPGRYNLRFGSQRDLGKISEAVSSPLDSLCPTCDDEGRLAEFDRLSAYSSSVVSNIEYVITLYTKTHIPPLYYGTRYQSGVYEGSLMIYNYNTKELVAKIDLKATSSIHVETDEDGDLNEAIQANFISNINEKISEALTRNYNIKGSISKVKRVNP